MPELTNQKSKPAIHVTQSARSRIPYAELQVATNFSFLRGASHAEELAATAATLGHHAIAITDINSLAGIVRAHVAAEEAKIPLVIGCHLQLNAEAENGVPRVCTQTRASCARESTLHPLLSTINHDNFPLNLLVYPTNRQSYGRLCRMLTHGKRRAAKGHCDLSLHDVVEFNEGLLAVALPPPLLTPEFTDILHFLKTIFTDDRLSLAANCLYNGYDQTRLADLAALARNTNIPLVATNDVHYHIPERQPLQDVLTCIRLGCTIEQAGLALFANAERHLKTPEEMARLFADYPHAITRTMQIAARALNFSLDEIKYEYPHEICPPGKTLMQHLIDRTWQGARERYKDLADSCAQEPGATGVRSSHTRASCAPASHCTLTDPNHPQNAHIPQTIKERLAHEFKLIEELNYPAYFLTVDDIVRFARSQGILCQGRGAAANSAVCYCLGVTAVDPARIDLLVERFISKERDEPPDIDIDFEHERREEVIQYLYNKYGRERAALTAEVICYRRRSAVREVGKAMGLSLDCVDRLAKSGDWWEDDIIAKDRLKALGLDWNDPTLQRTIKLAQELIGFPRHLSQHVGGFVLSKGPLCESVPIENASMPDRTVIEWDKDDIDAMGMLKVDVLGLGMLTAIRKALDMVNAWHRLPADDRAQLDANHASTTDLSHPYVPSPELASSRRPLQFHTVPPEDPAVYDMLCNADSIGVFQVESRAQMTMLPRLKPRRYYDLVIEVAIVRPGPIQGGMIHPYLRRRNGEEEITYPNDQIKQVLGRTLGVPLFQEQAMRLVMVAAGFTAGEADKLRRAMAAWKKKGNLIETFAKKIVTGMTANGYTPAYAQRVVEQIKGFSEYGFPESHAASFALLVYVSAWLKHHHPAAFAAALINSQPMGFYQPAQIVRCAQNHGVQVLPVDVNKSGWDCRLETNDEIRMTNDESNPNVQMTNARNGCHGSVLRPVSHVQSHLVASTPVTMQTPWGKITMPNQPSDAHPPVSSFNHSSFEFDSSFVIRHSIFPPPPALRLGMRIVAGLRETEARKIESAVQNHGPFPSITALWRASNVRVATLKTLAAADAFSSMGLDRQQALWSVSKLKDQSLPIFDLVERETIENDKADLPRISDHQLVVHDYATIGLSLKAHPISFVRPQLDRLNVTSAGELASEQLSPQGRKLAVAGLVLVRQRPSTAAGVLFVTLEDETGIANLVVRPNIYDQYRAALRNNVCLIVWGKVERQGQVVHVLVERAADLASATRKVPAVQSQSRDFH